MSLVAHTLFSLAKQHDIAQHFCSLIPQFVVRPIFVRARMLERRECRFGRESLALASLFKTACWGFADRMLEYWVRLGYVYIPHYHRV